MMIPTIVRHIDPDFIDPSLAKAGDYVITDTQQHIPGMLTLDKLVVYHDGFGLRHVPTRVRRVEVTFLQSESKKPFYMVYVEGGASPRNHHPTQLSAEIEAERLCRQEGRRAYVLAPIRKVEQPQAPITWTDL